MKLASYCILLIQGCYLDSLERKVFGTKVQV